MANFPAKFPDFKDNNSARNSRSPLNDPFFAESLIIQSKSIVGRMYSANESARFKYECELNRLVKEFRVWLGEIQREEREVAGKLDAMRLEQREIGKERRDIEAAQLMARTNREFIDHYKQRRNKASVNHRYLFNDPLKFSNDFRKRKANLKSVRLPEIVKKVEKVDDRTKSSVRAVNLPSITSQNHNRNIATTKTQVSDKRLETKKSDRVGLVEGLPNNILAADLPSRTRPPRVLSAPKSQRDGQKFQVLTVRPSSAGLTSS